MNTRRRFLEESLLGAAALALARVPGEAAPRPPRRRRGPNDRVHMAVIGVRGRGEDHINGWCGMQDVVLAAICDVDEGVGRQRVAGVEKRGRPAPIFHQDLRRILDDPTIDAVSIATPNHWHALAAIWAMQAGKDVYVEKPVSHNVSEGRRMVQAARRYGRICQTGTQCRSMKGTRDAIAFVHEGRIGEVRVARGLCYKRRDSIGRQPDGPVPAGVDYDLWLGPAPVKPFNPNRFHYNWHWMWDTGNGDLGNQGIHQMDIARWGLGMTSLPRGVIGLGGRFGYVDDGQTPNTHLTILDYGPKQLIFEVRGLPTPPLRGASVGVIFHGSDGYVVLPSYDGGAAFDRDGKEVQVFKGGGDHYRNFIDAVKSRRAQDLTAEIEEGHLSSALCHLGNISYLLGEETPFTRPAAALAEPEALETFNRMEEHLAENGVKAGEITYRLGRPLRLDPRRERFVGDREADRLLTRDYRAPFVVPARL